MSSLHGVCSVFDNAHIKVDIVIGTPKKRLSGPTTGTTAIAKEEEVFVRIECCFSKWILEVIEV